MSDKPLVQQRLASDLSSIILQINPRSTTDGEDEEEDSLARDMAALDFIEGFWEAIIREWVGIDRFRCVSLPVLLERRRAHSEVVEWTNTTCSSDDGSTLPSACSHARNGTPSLSIGTTRSL